MEYIQLYSSQHPKFQGELNQIQDLYNEKYSICSFSRIILSDRHLDCGFSWDHFYCKY